MDCTYVALFQHPYGTPTLFTTASHSLIHPFITYSHTKGWLPLPSTAPWWRISQRSSESTCQPLNTRKGFKKPHHLAAACGRNAEDDRNVSASSRREARVANQHTSKQHLLSVTATRRRRKRASRQLSSDSQRSPSLSQMRDGPSALPKKSINLGLGKEASHICCTSVS